MRMTAVAFLIAAALAASGQSAPERYAEGQVWEYRTRPSDAGSLVKIQRIEALERGSSGERVYHISIIGFRMANPHIPPVLSHLPVSRQTLDASVTRPAAASADFPPLSVVDEGIAIWRENRGGVFTIPLSEIVGIADEQLRNAAPEPSPRSSPSS